MQIVYYSLNGTTERIARKLATALDLPLYRIEDASTRRGILSFIRSGFEAKYRKSPKIRVIESYQTDPEHVVLLAPIWASSICSPLRTFCTQNAGKFQSFSLILTHANPKKRYEKMEEEVATLTGARCQVFESYWANDIDQIDIQALSNQLDQTVLK